MVIWHSYWHGKKVSLLCGISCVISEIFSILLITLNGTVNGFSPMWTHTDKASLMCGPSPNTTENFDYIKIISYLCVISFVQCSSFYTMFQYLYLLNKVFLLWKSIYISLCVPLAYNFYYTSPNDKASLPFGPSYLLLHLIF